MSKKFSMFDDPSFRDYTEEDWKEWGKNQPKVAPSICQLCLYSDEYGQCSLHELKWQLFAVADGKCEDQLEENVEL